MSGRLGLVVSEFANNGGPTTGDIHRRTGTSREGREPVLANIHWVYPEHLLITTDCWGIGTHSETGTNQLLLDGG
jgi:hypothetical protein